MKHNKLIVVLIVILLASVLTVFGILFSMKARTDYIPENSVETIVSILEQSGVDIDPAVIPRARGKSAVYVFSSEDYCKNVASSLGGAEVSADYITPDGEIVTLSNGARTDFGSSFSFHFYRDGITDSGLFSLTPTDDEAQVSEETEERVRWIVSEFLSSGSTFDTSSVNVSVSVDRIWAVGDVLFAICTRTIGTVEITGNSVICAVRGSQVAEAYGTWCFLTTAKIHYVNTCDIPDILFRFRSEADENSSLVSIERIDMCYSFYFYGDSEDFCLIPCRKLVTDCMGEYIYNAIDGSLYTKK